MDRYNVGGKERRGEEMRGGGTYRIVSRFIASVAWNNKSTEMFDLLALSVHDGRAEREKEKKRDGCDGARAGYDDIE